MCGGRRGKESERKARRFFFLLLFFFLLASPFIYSSFDRLLVLAISERENAFSDVAGRGEREGGREGTYNVATSSRRLDAGFGTVQQVDEQVSRFPSFEFAFPSLSRRVVAARFSLTNFLRDTIPFHYHSSQTIISSLCNDQIIFYNFIFFLNSPFHDIFIKTYEYVKNNFTSKSYNEIISPNTFLNPNPLL